MFLGEFTHTIDDKGRLTLPAKFRDVLSHGVVITRGLDGCLFVFTYQDWQTLTARLSERLSLAQKSARDLTRFFYAGATDIIPDKTGRVLIPPFLREYADLDSDVVIIGANSRLELWSTERWQQTMLEVESSVEEIAEQFSDLTF
jgi:MraZ protein